jgi:hypothetical protein
VLIGADVRKERTIQRLKGQVSWATFGAFSAIIHVPCSHVYIRNLREAIKNRRKMMLNNQLDRKWKEVVVA